jgi:hypothetical protein
LDVLIGCCLGLFLGAADSYSWGFGQSMRTKVARRAEHNRLRLLRLLRLPSWRVWNRGGTWDLAGLLVEGVRYPESSSIRLMVLAAKNVCRCYTGGDCWFPRVDPVEQFVCLSRT